MNLTSIEKVRCMLSNANLCNQFWAKALSYITFIMNKFPCSGVEYQTLIEVWLGSHISYDNVHKFSCWACCHARDEKIDPRTRKALFMGSSERVIRYKL